MGIDTKRLDADRLVNNLGSMFIKNEDYTAGTSATYMTKGQIIAVTGKDGGYITCSKAQADVALDRSELWIARSDIWEYGKVARFGLLEDVDTADAAIGDPVYLSDTAGGWSLLPGTAEVVIGKVLVSSATIGEIWIDLGNAHLPGATDARLTSTFFDDMLGDPATAIAQPWVANAETANITVDYTSGLGAGVVRILTDSTSEPQAGNLTWGDTLHINMSNNPVFEARVRFAPAGATFTADERFVVGLGSAHANAEDTLDTVTTNAWFRVEGASLNILVEGDDGTTDTDLQDSTIDIVKSAWTLFKIDASDLSDVKFYVDGVEQGGAAVDMSALGANTYVQPIICMQRDAGTEANSLDVDFVKVTVDR